MTAAAPTTTYLYGGESRGYLHDLHVCRNFKLSARLIPRSNNGVGKELSPLPSQPLPWPARPAPPPAPTALGAYYSPLGKG